jgi:ferredoxin/flavodoxin---NADP+ reductase
VVRATEMEKLVERAENILIIGAGPASLYAASRLRKEGKNVFIVNRDIRPGGLAEFGIYPNKYKMKNGLRKVFLKTLNDERVRYFGNVQVGLEADVSLEELQGLGFDAVIVAVGAQGTKWLGLPGEQGGGVYHAKDLVYHYNHLPPYSEKDFALGRRVCVIGLGNVSLDIVHWMVCERKVETVTTIARRGPQERKYTSKEMKLVSGALDTAFVEAEMERIGPMLVKVEQDPEVLLGEITKFVDVPLETESNTHFRMRFLRSPKEVVRNDAGETTGLLCDCMELCPRADGTMGVASTGEVETIPCDTVVFAIGDSIEKGLGLPLEPKWRSTFATDPEPWSDNPERPRYAAYDPESGKAIHGTFLFGWARVASDGLVGKARADAMQGCDEVFAYLDGSLGEKCGETNSFAEMSAKLHALLTEKAVNAIPFEDVEEILAAQSRIAHERGLPEYKFSHRDEMIALVAEMKEP